MEDVKGCGATMFSIMHYIPRSKNGLGIPANGAVGCQCHHDMLDNGRQGRREEMLGLFAVYLQQFYPEWNESDLVYDQVGFSQRLRHRAKAKRNRDKRTKIFWRNRK